MFNCCYFAVNASFNMSIVNSFHDALVSVQLCASMHVISVCVFLSSIESFPHCLSVELFVCMSVFVN